MNGAHLHLMINHLPVLGVGFGLLLLLAARFRRSTELTNAALVVFVLAAAAAGTAYLTGEPAEGAVEDVAAVTESSIEQHEEAATVALVLTGLLGAGALFGLVGFLDGAGFVLVLVLGGLIGRGLVELAVGQLLDAVPALGQLLWIRNPLPSKDIETPKKIRLMRPLIQSRKEANETGAVASDRRGG